MCSGDERPLCKPGECDDRFVSGLADRGLGRFAKDAGSRPVIERVLVDLPDRACIEVLAAGARLVVKVDTVLERSRREVAALAAARRDGVHVPGVVWHSDDEPAVLVLEWLDGVPLHRTDDGWEALQRQTNTPLCSLIQNMPSCAMTSSTRPIAHVSI